MMIKHDRFSIAIFSEYVFREIRQYVIRPTLCDPSYECKLTLFWRVCISMCTMSYVRVFACFQSISLIVGFYFFLSLFHFLQQVLKKMTKQKKSSTMMMIFQEIIDMRKLFHLNELIWNWNLPKLLS